MSILTLRSGGTAHPEDSVLQLITDLLEVQGVKDLSSDNHFKVTEKSGTPNMSVDVAAGRAFVMETANSYPVRNTATYNIVVTSNASGNSRIDSVVLYIDLAASPTAISDNVAKMVVVAGTPSGSPSAPDDTAIGTAIGASNPYMVLANVTVASGATSIVNANISDQRKQYVKKGGLVSADTTYASTTTFDVSRYNYRYVTLTGNPTLAVTGDQTDKIFFIKLIQDGTGGRTVTWWSNIDWYGGTPILTTTANRADEFCFTKKSNGRYDGRVVGQDATIS